jgi:hypothetical protein
MLSFDQSRRAAERKPAPARADFLFHGHFTACAIMA